MRFLKRYASDILDELIKISKANHFTKRKFCDVKSIINMVLDLAAEKQHIVVNPARTLHRIPYDNFCVPDKIKDKNEEVYTRQDELMVLNRALQKYQKTGATINLAIILSFFTGCRAGELVALKASDLNVQTKTLRIQRSEVKNVVQGNDGLQHVCGVKVVPHLKKGKKYRDINVPDVAIFLLRKFRRQI